MSMHEIALSNLERSGLIAHGLDVGTPSQLSDAFRLGSEWALKAAYCEKIGADSMDGLDCCDNYRDWRESISNIFNN